MVFKDVFLWQIYHQYNTQQHHIDKSTLLSIALTEDILPTINSRISNVIYMYASIVCSESLSNSLEKFVLWSIEYIKFFLTPCQREIKLTAAIEGWIQKMSKFMVPQLGGGKLRNWVVLTGSMTRGTICV